MRYYEKIGIFQEIRRNASGHRDFTEKDLLWAEFINRLKETGMSLEKIKKYALLRQQGESTANARKNLLEDHASVLKNKISEEKKHLRKIKEKIEYYEKVILEKKLLDLELTLTCKLFPQVNPNSSQEKQHEK